MPCRRFAAALAAAAVFALRVSTVQAAPITLDPDSYAAGTNISQALGGVTLSAVAPNTMTVISDVFSATAIVNPGINIPTGSRVFGADPSLSLPFLFRTASTPNDRWLLIEFDDAVNSVSIDFGRQSTAQSAMSFAFLQAFDENGIVVDTATGAGLQALLTATLTVDSSENEIAYVVAHSGAGVLALDHLVFDRLPALAVPNPAALLLFASGGIGLVLTRGRRRIGPAR